MPKMKQRLSSKNSINSLFMKAKRIASLSSSSSKMSVRRRRKRKVGVTLITAVKKKRPLVDVSFLNEAVTDRTLKQNANMLVHKVYENLNKCRPQSDLKTLSSNTYKAANCSMPDSVKCGQNDTDNNRAEATFTSSLSPIVIDDSSDSDCSSAADTTNVCNTSAVSDACNSEGVDYCDEERGRITHGLG